MSDHFNKEDLQNAYDAVVDMHKGLPKSKQFNYLGHLSEALLALADAKKHAPEKPA